MLRTRLCLGVLVAACSAPPRPPPHAAAVEVPEAPEGETGGEELAAIERPEPPQNLESCIARLRASPGLDASTEAASTYASALDLERRRELANARRAYFELIQRAPQSAYVPLAYFAFAELFAAELDGDPSRLDLTRQAYREVLKYPPPNNPVHTTALVRLGRIEMKAGDGVQALSNATKALQNLRSTPDQPCASELDREARQGLVEAYVERGEPARAWAFLSRTDTGGEQLFEALLAEYARRGKSAEACEALRGAGRPCR
jgi:tetratricopeptide (TPR) repeat protein